MVSSYFLALFLYADCESDNGLLIIWKFCRVMAMFLHILPSGTNMEQILKPSLASDWDGSEFLSSAMATLNTFAASDESLSRLATVATSQCTWPQMDFLLCCHTLDSGCIRRELAIKLGRAFGNICLKLSTNIGLSFKNLR